MIVRRMEYLSFSPLGHSCRVHFRKSTKTLLFSTKATSLSFKKLMIPLVKTIHPDSCANESETVRTANLLSLQALNELSDKISSVETDVLSGKVSVSVTSAMKHVYPLQIWVIDNSEYGNKESKGRKAVNIIFQVPREFTTVQTLTFRDGRKALRNMYLSLLSVLKQANCKGPDLSYNELDMDSVNKVSPTSASKLDSLNLTEENLRDYGFDTKIFERMVAFAKYGHAATGALFSIPSRKTNKIPTHVKALADSYLKQGNVMVKNLSPAEEIQAIGRLREFIIEYAIVMNFHPGAWKKVFFILCSQRTKCVLKEKLGGYFVLIPANFKHRELLEFLRVNLPTLLKHIHSPTAASAGLDEDDLEELQF